MLHPIANELKSKYAEHLEMCSQPNEMLINILSKLLQEARDHEEYLKIRINRIEK